MARRPIWRGAVAFGMVAIPIKLYTATESKDIAFHNLHATCNSRIRQKRWCPEHEQEVPVEEIVKGYEFGKDQYVVLEQDDFENLPIVSAHTIEINQFVDLTKVDPINFERTYMIEPEGVGTKPFYLLKQALETSKRAAIAKVSMRQKEQICCLRPYEHGIALHTMHWPDEIRGVNELNLPEEKTAITAPEMKMAMTLIDHLTSEYDPSIFHDDYRETLEKIIAAKVNSQEPVLAELPEPKGKIGDLMEALRASIAAAKKGETPSILKRAEAPDEVEAGEPKKPARTGARKKAS